MRVFRGGRTVAGLVGGLCGALLTVVALLAPAAQAQTVTCSPPDPYTGQQQCTLHLTLHLSLMFGPAGSQIHVKAWGFFAGDPVAGTFDGAQVFNSAAKVGVGLEPAAANPVAMLAGLLHTRAAAIPAQGGIDEVVTVPNKAPGEYPVCVAGSGAQACATFRIVPAAQVLGLQLNNPDSPAAVSGTGTNGNVNAVRPTTGSNGNALARTGMDVGLLVMLGLGLILLGRQLRTAAARRRDGSTISTP